MAIPEGMDPVQLLLHERDIHRVLVDYCSFVDFGEAGRMAELFTEDGVWLGADGRGMHGLDEIRKAFSQRQTLTRRASRHSITNVSIDVLSDTEARARCYLINYRHDVDEGVPALPVPARLPKFTGEYHDELVRTDAGWRIRHRRFDLVFLRHAAPRP